MQKMLICTGAETRYGLIRVAVSLPLVPALVDGVKYRMPDDPPTTGSDLDPVNPPQAAAEAARYSHRGAQKRAYEKTRRAPRAPTLRSLVKLALRCDSAEQMGKQLKKRFDRQQRARGIDPNKARQAKAERELERLLQD
jgi:hypothetical protein